MEYDLIRREYMIERIRNSGYAEQIKSNLFLMARMAPAVDAVEVSGATRQAVELIVVERRRQIAEWGVQSDINPFEFMSILGEEYGELCQAVNETLFVNPKHPERGGIDAIRREAVQVAAVAAQIIEACMDGRREEEYNAKAD